MGSNPVEVWCFPGFRCNCSLSYTVAVTVAVTSYCINLLQIGVPLGSKKFFAENMRGVELKGINYWIKHKFPWRVFQGRGWLTSISHGSSSVHVDYSGVSDRGNPIRYQNIASWVWPKFIFTPKSYQVSFAAVICRSSRISEVPGPFWKSLRRESLVALNIYLPISKLVPILFCPA